ncbi:50S ribosomal protein L24 [Glycine soja]
MGWKATEKLIRHWKILRGDNVCEPIQTCHMLVFVLFINFTFLFYNFSLIVTHVMITRDIDKGETGIIKRVIRSQNYVKKHIKQGKGHEGGIFTVEAPLHASNVQVLDPVIGYPCKVGVKYLEDGTKVRVSRGIGELGSIVPRPKILKIRTISRPTICKYLTSLCFFLV